MSRNEIHATYFHEVRITGPENRTEISTAKSGARIYKRSGKGALRKSDEIMAPAKCRRRDFTVVSLSTGITIPRESAF